MFAELLTVERSEALKELLDACACKPSSWALGGIRPEMLSDYLLMTIRSAVAQGGMAKTYLMGGKVVGMCVVSPDDWSSRELAVRTYRLSHLIALGGSDAQLMVKQLLLREALRDIGPNVCLVAEVPYADLTSINALERCGFTATQTSLMLAKDLAQAKPTISQPEPYEVRPAEPDDIDVLEDAVIAVPDGILGWDLRLDRHARSRIHRDWLKWYAQQHSLLLAYDQGRPVGLLAERLRTDVSRLLGFGIGSIDLVATVPEYRNNGVANRLVEGTLSIFRNAGVRLAELSVHSADVPVAQGFQSEGFVTVASSLTLTNL